MRRKTSFNRTLSASPPADVGGGRQPRLQLPSPWNFISRIVNGAFPRSPDNLLTLRVGENAMNADPSFFGSPTTSAAAVRKSRSSSMERAPASPARCVSTSAETPPGSPNRCRYRDDGAAACDKIEAENPFAFRQCKHCAGLCYNPHDFGKGIFCSGECEMCFAIMARDPAVIPRNTSARDHKHVRRRERSSSEALCEGWHGVGSHESR